MVGTEIFSYRHFTSFDFTAVAVDSFDEVDAHDNGIAHVRTESYSYVYHTYLFWLL